MVSSKIYYMFRPRSNDDSRYEYLADKKLHHWDFLGLLKYFIFASINLEKKASLLKEMPKTLFYENNYICME